MSCLALPPKGMDSAEAPASAYLQALLYDNGLKFVHDNGKWYITHMLLRRYCFLPIARRARALLPPNASKRSTLWNLKLPDPLDQLVNDYEKRQISLCSLFSTTVINVTPTHARHVQGEVSRSSVQRTQVG